MTPAILSIQSDVVYGHVGQGAARFAMQRLGFDVLALPTVLFSNHPGHKGMRGRAVPADDLAELVAGLDERGFLGSAAGVVTGYLGAAGQAAVAAAAIARVKASNPRAIVLVDPVFGDEDGAYAQPGVAEAIARHLLPLADIATPNRFELSSLTSRRIESPAGAVAAARLLGRSCIVATSIPFPGGLIGAVAVTPEGSWGCAAPRLETPPQGTGDLLAAIFLVQRLRNVAVPEALAAATSAADAMVGAAVAGGLKEMPLIARQDLLLAPPHLTSAPVG